MKNFVLGFIVALLVAFGGVYMYVKKGYLSFDADQAPTQFEEHTAMAAVDAATDKRAGEAKNPLTADDATLAAGAKLYLDHCAGCHGVPSNPESTFAKSFNPEVPSFFKDAPDMSDTQNFYIIQHGIRWTGMPAWKQTMNDTQTWQVVTFLSHIEKLPPAVEKVLTIYGETPAASGASDDAKPAPPTKEK
jgi:mono/diheme cytochrome c family protein